MLGTIRREDHGQAQAPQSWRADLDQHGLYAVAFGRKVAEPLSDEIATWQRFDRVGIHDADYISDVRPRRWPGTLASVLASVGAFGACRGPAPSSILTTDHILHTNTT